VTSSGKLLRLAKDSAGQKAKLSGDRLKMEKP